MNTPLISVCIPVYNAGKYIHETLHALCSQTYDTLEIIAVDDGSTDNSAGLIEAFGDPRITLIRQTNRGAGYARNAAYKLAKGAFLVFFDADDLIAPDFLQSQYDAIRHKNNCLAVSGWGRFFPQDGRVNIVPDLITTPHTLKEWILTYWSVNQHNTPPGRLLIPIELVSRAGGWNEKLTLNDDFEFFTRIALQAEQIVPNPEAIYAYRSAVGGLSSRKSESAYLSLFNSMQWSFAYVEKRYPDDSRIKKCFANLWQSFIFEAYPHRPLERQIAGKKIKELGGSILTYPSGPKGKLLLTLFGWKIFKRLAASYYSLNKTSR